VLGRRSDLIVGVIGVGNMGQNHARVYSELRGVEEVIVYDSDPGKRLRGVHTTADLGDLLDAVDLVSICTPTPSHKDVVCRVAEVGIPFLVEKPLASTLDDALAIGSISVQIAGVGHIERFNLTAATACQLATRPAHISIRRHNPWSSRVTDTSVVHDLMIHDIDLVRHVLFDRDPDTIVSVVTPNAARTIMTFGESVVSLSASRSSMVKVRDISIECDDYTIVADMIDQALCVYWRPDHTEFAAGEFRQEQSMEKIVVPRVEPLRAELTEFVRCVADGDAFPVTIDQAIVNMELCEMIHDSKQCNCGAGCCHR